eukprot:s1648_g12.t1
MGPKCFLRAWWLVNWPSQRLVEGDFVVSIDFLLRTDTNFSSDVAIATSMTSGEVLLQLESCPWPSGMSEQPMAKDLGGEPAEIKDVEKQDAEVTPAWLMGSRVKMTKDGKSNSWKSSLAESIGARSRVESTGEGSAKMSPSDAQERWSDKMRMSQEALDCLEQGDCDSETFSSHSTRCSDTILTFKDIAFQVTQNNGQKKDILAPISGHFESGHLAAIMGPSGKSDAYSGTVHFNGRPRDKLFPRISAYAVEFNGMLKFERPSLVSRKMAQQWILRRLEVLGLMEDTYIGDATSLRGISGGQKRRLSLAKRLTSGAQVFFCDEPTSGLSATDAETCMRYMKHIAQFYNVIVVVVIHQPRILHSSFRHANPVDYFMDLVTPEVSTSQVDLFVQKYREQMEENVLTVVNEGLQAEMPSALELLENIRSQMLKWGRVPALRNRLLAAQAEPCRSSRDRSCGLGSKYGVRFRRQFWYVFKRQLKLRWRDQNGLLADLLGGVIKAAAGSFFRWNWPSALVVGIVYMRTGELDVKAQVSFFFMLCMSCAIDGLKTLGAAADEFEELPNDGTSHDWQRVNAAGAFVGFRYAYSDVWRNLPFAGASLPKYRIITGAGNPHIQVAKAESDEECLTLLKKLNSLTAEDVMATYSSDRKEMLNQLVERAESTHEAVTNEHLEFLSTEMLQKVSNLESEKASLQQELEEARRALRDQELEKQDIQDKFCAVMAQQALEQVAEKMNDEAKLQESSTERTCYENRPDTLGQPCEDSTLGDASGAESNVGILPEALTANAGTSEDVRCLLFSHAHGSTQSMELQHFEGTSFQQRVMHGPFHTSMAKQFWQLAAAPYRAISSNHADDKDYVELGGRLWEVIAHNPATETLVIGRKDGTTYALEVGFRGTVMVDAYGNTSWANWSSDLHVATAPLQVLNSDNVNVTVHKGLGFKSRYDILFYSFQDAYLAISSSLISWLEKSAGDKRLVRIAGHSLGAALATLFAVDIQQRGWQIDGVVTFGSPRVGQSGFKSLYQELGLHRLTVRFANGYDPVPWVPALAWGFEHVVEACALGLQAPTGSPHSIADSSTSYRHTLQDAVDGREVQHIAVRGVNLITDCVKAMYLPPTLSSMATQIKEEVKVDIGLVRQDLSKLAEGMQAAVRELKNHVRQQGIPGWFLDYKKRLKRILEAAKLELNDVTSQLAPKLVILYLHAASFLIAAMRTSGARPRDVEKEFGDFVAAAKGVVWHCFHLNLSVLQEIVQLLPSSDDMSLPGNFHRSLQGRILKVHGRSVELEFPLLQLMKRSCMRLNLVEVSFSDSDT